jgi:hypothetical protein
VNADCVGVEVGLDLGTWIFFSAGKLKGGGILVGLEKMVSGHWIDFLSNIWE